MREGNKKKMVQTVIFILTFGAAFFGTKYVMSGFNLVEKELKKTALEINKSCPKIIDAETRLDSASADHKTLQYHYTILNWVKTARSGELAQDKKQVQVNAQMNLDTSTTMKEFREKGISLKYTYNNKNGQPIFNFTIKAK